MLVVFDRVADRRGVELAVAIAEFCEALAQPVGVHQEVWVVVVLDQLRVFGDDHPIEHFPKQRNGHSAILNPGRRPSHNVSVDESPSIAMTSSDRTGRCLINQDLRCRSGVRPGAGIVEGGGQCGRALEQHGELIAQAARMRCAGFSGQPGEAFDVVAFVRVDDPLDSGHLPGRLDRRVVEWTTSHPPIAPVWTIEQCEQPLAWCRVGCLGHLVGLAGGLPEPAQVLLHQHGLTRKVLVESPLGYRSLVRNQFDPGGVDALAVEQLCSRLQDTLTSAAAPAPTGGRVGCKLRLGAGFRKPVPTLLLEHRSRKSGKNFVAPLLYITDRNNVIVVASALGQAENPQWYRNLPPNPDTHIQIGIAAR